jgi:hypothetical protein
MQLHKPVRGNRIFAHLLALKCAEKAVVDRRDFVTLPHLNFAMTAAMAEIDPNLTAAFLDAVGDDLESNTVGLLKKAAFADEKNSRPIPQTRRSS